MVQSKTNVRCNQRRRCPCLWSLAPCAAPWQWLVAPRCRYLSCVPHIQVFVDYVEGIVASRISRTRSPGLDHLDGTALSSHTSLPTTTHQVLGVLTPHTKTPTTWCPHTPPLYLVIYYVYIYVYTHNRQPHAPRNFATTQTTCSGETSCDTL